MNDTKPSLTINQTKSGNDLIENLLIPDNKGISKESANKNNKASPLESPFDTLDFKISERPSCCYNCCYYLFCCCCCCCCWGRKNQQPKSFYINKWRAYLENEGTESPDLPFIILTNLYANENVLNELQSWRVNPNLISNWKLRNDLEFYIPQWCTFLLFGDIKAIEEFFVFLCRVCSASFFFAHRIHWFLSSMINAADKNDEISNILRMISTLFKSESNNKCNLINNLYITNSAFYIDYIKSNNLYFLYQPGTAVDFTSFNPEDQEWTPNQELLFEKFKQSKQTMIAFSDNEYNMKMNMIKWKDEDQWNPMRKTTGTNSLGNGSNFSNSDNTNNDWINNRFKKYKPDEFFIDISCFSIINPVLTYTEEEEDENDFIQVSTTFNKDINYLSYRSSINFFEHWADISNQMSNIPVQDQWSFWYREWTVINKKWPCNIYLPFLKSSTRNYLICHIPLHAVKIFRTKTRAPIMLTFELIRFDEIINEIKANTGMSTLLKTNRSKSISSIENHWTDFRLSAMERGISRDNVRPQDKSRWKGDKKETKQNLYIEVDEVLSKPIMLNNQTNQGMKINSNNDELNKAGTIGNEWLGSRLSVNEDFNDILNESLCSFKGGNLDLDDKMNQEDEEQRIKNIINKFHKKKKLKIPKEWQRMCSKTIFQKRSSTLTNDEQDPLEQRDVISNEVNTNTKLLNPFRFDSTVRAHTIFEKPTTAMESSFEEAEHPNKEVTDNILSEKSINWENWWSIFGDDFSTQHNKIKSESLFGNMKSHQIFKAIIKTNEDLRQEQFATQLINEFYQIFKISKVKCWLNTYEIIATGDNSGLIEMVPDSLSLDQWKQKASNLSWHDFFWYYFGRGNKKARAYKKAMKKFVRSLAGYSLVCYFLQIKDRHNGNILLDKEGHIIHIDFGFLLSNAPGKGIQFENAPFKLTNDMVDCLGGVNSNYFNDFRKLLQQGFAAISKHRNKIIIWVEMMWCGHGKNLPCFEGEQDTIVKLKQRLIPIHNMTKGDIYRYVDELIGQSVDNWRTRWYDYFQYMMQGIFY